VRAVADLDLRAETDPSSEPVDWDREIARLLLHIVRQKRSRSSSVAPAAGSGFHARSGASQERHVDGSATRP
jgi:hypothetical protein